jgi:hypothetical protein
MDVSVALSLLASELTDFAAEAVSLRFAWLSGCLAGRRLL